ncbi:hydrolase 2, exosortase A system-associated [Azohydromonas aeria]|uniref:hydrolase 2, exosortase A system-associated n=1 Tax=Azohydromonas aeria TaxID=2590212 RepID=UPI001E4FB447|nr:hydrolase 2, exosortase A system-associated [Azohydromonas aeria]
MKARPFFLGSGAGQRWACFHEAQSAAPHALVLYLHPLAEEMNKARRMAALQSRALAEAGCAVLQLDLHGCGDSAGDFADASWRGWTGDALAGARWLRGQHPGAPLWLWGLRTGGLLAAAAAREIDEPCNLLLWQPPPSGELALRQFLRLRLAAALGEGSSAELMKALRRQLAEGQAVEVAGYGLSPALADGLQQATLAPPPRAARLAWLETGAQAAPEAALAPAALELLSRWRQAGWQVQARRVPGPAFWQTAEVETAPALLQATLDVFSREGVSA